MSEIQDPKNLAGIGELVNIDSDVLDISNLEEELISGAEFLQEEKVDPAAAFNSEMNKIQENINLDFINATSPKKESPVIEPIGEENISTDTGYSYPLNENYEAPSYSWRPADPQLSNMTLEQKKQSHIDSVMENIDTIEMGEIDKEREEDDKANLLEQISTLRSTLEDDGIDISRIEEVDHSCSMEQIKLVYKALRLKNDGNRYRSFAEELILAGAQGLEYLFDGEKEWFGKKPDLVGWSDTVKVKLRRMRYETTTFVKEVMQEYNISPGFRIALELIPSMFLYTRNRKINQNDTIISDDQFKNSISKLNSI